jgi:hypothetical protein
MAAAADLLSTAEQTLSRVKAEGQEQAILCRSAQPGLMSAFRRRPQQRV